MKVTAIASDVNSATTIVNASERKNTPAMPDSSASGRNTTTGVSVEPVSGVRISAMPSRTASKRPLPRRTCVWIASTTTIASSITSPIAAATPPSVIRLKLSLAAASATSVARTVTGITSTAVTVVRQLLRKPYRIATDRNSPKAIASHTPRTDARTSSD